MDCDAFQGLRCEHRAKARVAAGYADGVMCLGGRLGCVEVLQIALVAAVELLQRRRAFRSGFCMAVRGRIRTEELVQQGILSSPQPPVGEEEDFLQTWQLSLVGASQQVQALVAFLQQRTCARVDDGRLPPLEASVAGRGDGVLPGLVGLEAADDVVAQVRAGRGVRQVGGFTQEGAQQVKRAGGRGHA